MSILAVSTTPTQIHTTFKLPNQNLSSLCLVIVMRTTADSKDDASSSTSCVVDSPIENETNESVGVNKCVNIISNSYDNTSIHDDNDFLLSDQSAIDLAMPIYECIATELDDDGDDDYVKRHTRFDGPTRVDDDDDSLNKFLFNDDDDDDSFTSSKYSDVNSRCEMLPSTSSTTTARANDHVVTRYASTRDNNRKHQKAVRKNFSLWIGVTSCVWGLLLLLMKNYVD